MDIFVEITDFFFHRIENHEKQAKGKKWNSTESRMALPSPINSCNDLRSIAHPTYYTTYNSHKLEETT